MLASGVHVMHLLYGFCTTDVHCPHTLQSCMGHILMLTVLLQTICHMFYLRRLISKQVLAIDYVFFSLGWITIPLLEPQ